ncbi:MAG: hypothetical protein WCK94_02275 [Comamonadaceae bacterium]
MNIFNKLNTALAAIGLLMASSAALAQTPAKPAAAPATKASAAPAAKPPAPNSSPAACVAEMTRANAAFGTELAAGVKSGKINAKEKISLDSKQAALLKKETAAKADGKITEAECNGILNDIKAEHAALVKALATPPAGPASPAACLAEMNKATTAFGTELAAGVKSGRIDAKEKADLDARHAALLKKEAAAKADGHITAPECHSILASIHAEHAALVKALAAPPVKPTAPASRPAAPASRK